MFWIGWIAGAISVGVFVFLFLKLLPGPGG